MNKFTTFLIVAGILLIIIGVLFFVFCYMASDPEIEGESGRTPLSAYFISTIPIVLGALLLILSYKNNKKKISN
jgi:hypothetical protein